LVYKWCIDFGQGSGQVKREEKKFRDLRRLVKNIIIRTFDLDMNYDGVFFQIILVQNSGTRFCQIFCSGLTLYQYVRLCVPTFHPRMVRPSIWTPPRRGSVGGGSRVWVGVRWGRAAGPMRKRRRPALLVLADGTCGVVSETNLQFRIATDPNIFPD